MHPTQIRALLALSGLSLVACGPMLSGDQSESPEAADSYATAALGAALDALVETEPESEEEAPSAEAFGPIGRGRISRGCLTFSTDPAPLPIPLPSAYNLTWEFDDCPFGLGGHQSGVRDLAVTVSGNQRELHLARDISRRFLGGGGLEIDTQATLTAEGLRRSGQILRTLTADEHRVRTGPRGGVWFDVNIAFSPLRAHDSYDSTTRQITRRLLNGEASLTANRAGATATASFEDVTIEWGVCCLPTSGTLRLALSENGRQVEHSYRYTGTCGEVEVDGQRVIELASCEL